MTRDLVTEHDQAIRLCAFEFLRRLQGRHGEVLPRSELAQGFDYQGNRVPLLGPQGIFKPALLSRIPLSITTAPVKPGRPRPYEDVIRYDGLLDYRYRGIDPDHPDNVGLREAMRTRVPLIYFHGIEPGWYLASWPAYIVGDDAGKLTFTVALDEPGVQEEVDLSAGKVEEARRRYYTVQIQQRIHQQAFRMRVLRAYQMSCGICQLRRNELLEAAHILPDRHPEGLPIVSNGIALCRIHHAAFDHHLLGIRPDLRLELRKDVLEEEDGPMLLHGLQGFHGQHLHIPRSSEDRPNPRFLEERYALFLKSA